MNAKLYFLPSGPRRTGGERNPRFVMAKRLEVLARPDMQEQLAECERLLTAHHVNRLLANTSDSPRFARNRQLD